MKKGKEYISERQLKKFLSSINPFIDTLIILAAMFVAFLIIGAWPQSDTEKIIEARNEYCIAMIDIQGICDLGEPCRVTCNFHYNYE